jgi:hypothetical protein
LRYSTDKQRKQKTSHEGCPSENRVEPNGMQGAPNVSAASKNGRGYGNGYQRYSLGAYSGKPLYSSPVCTVA